ncbi:Gfo/Idh/MocA family oxidoreductase [Sinomonas sp. JGH33]|uniref:Gfo/Idh/MocA family oxidoreductase n=2 Tax=Sinomonas terricola TaxID=3110330 RepID=A0ABU5TB38_9MICC|nr:Gfo/Idh/MocA family oxidoreductase [Sinomonas sp. JGH33]
MTVRVGIIGPGDVARLHVEALRAGGAEVTAVAGLTRQTAQEFAAEHRIPSAVSGAEALLARCDVDAVVIATPSPMHAAQSLAAVRAGKHVLCEIPGGMSAAESRAVAEACDRTGISVMVAHTLRFADPWMRLRAEISQGSLTVRHLILRRTMLRRSNTSWSGQPRSWNDSILWHHGAHQVDLTLWLLQGERPDSSESTATGVLGAPWEHNGQPMDLGATIRVGEGAIASLSLSYHSTVSVEDALVIAEEATFALSDGMLLRVAPDGLAQPWPLSAEPPKGQPASGTDLMKFAALRAQDAEFVAAIEEGREPRCSIRDVQATMTLLDALAGA